MLINNVEPMNNVLLPTVTAAATAAVQISDDYGPVVLTDGNVESHQRTVLLCRSYNQTTTWVHPNRLNQGRVIRTLDLYRMQTINQLGNLPNGWEMRVHTDNRVYFVDHITTLRHGMIPDCPVP